MQVPAADYAERLDADTQAVVASRVFYATGALQPVTDIAAEARRAGAMSTVDDHHGTEGEGAAFVDALQA